VAVAFFLLILFHSYRKTRGKETDEVNKISVNTYIVLAAIIFIIVLLQGIPAIYFVFLSFFSDGNEGWGRIMFAISIVPVIIALNSMIFWNILVQRRKRTSKLFIEPENIK